MGRSSSYIFKALRILGLEEMLKLSEAAKSRHTSLKKAVGEEFIVWDETIGHKPKTSTQDDGPARVLEFPKDRKSGNHEKRSEVSTEEVEAVEVGGKNSDDSPQVLNCTSEDLLWYRELSREMDLNIQKKDAAVGYRKSTEMYVVKTLDHEGKEKIRFASTHGVLVNKKQA